MSLVMWNAEQTQTKFNVKTKYKTSTAGGWNLGNNIRDSRVILFDMSCPARTSAGVFPELMKTAT